MFIVTDLVSLNVLKQIYSTLYLLVSYENILDPDQARQNWIQTVWHSDGIPKKLMF